MLELVNKILGLLMRTQQNQPESWQPVIEALDELNSIYPAYADQKFKFILRPEYKKLVNKATTNFLEKPFENIKGSKLRELIANSFLLKANKFLTPYLEQEHIFKNQQAEVDYNGANLKLQQISNLILKCRTELAYIDKEQELKIKSEGDEWISLNSVIKDLISRSELRKLTVAEKLLSTSVASFNTNAASAVPKHRTSFFGSLKSALSFKTEKSTESNTNSPATANVLDKVQLDKQTEQLEAVYKFLLCAELEKARENYAKLAKSISNLNDKIKFPKKPPANLEKIEHSFLLDFPEKDKINMTLEEVLNFLEDKIADYELENKNFLIAISDLRDLVVAKCIGQSESSSFDQITFEDMNTRIGLQLAELARLQKMRVLPSARFLKEENAEIYQIILEVVTVYLPNAIEQVELAFKNLHDKRMQDKVKNLFAANILKVLKQFIEIIPDLTINAVNYSKKINELNTVYIQQFLAQSTIDRKTVVINSLNSFGSTAEPATSAMLVDQTLIANNINRPQSTSPKQLPVQISIIKEICQLAFKEIALGNFDSALGMLTPLLIEIKLKKYDRNSTCPFPQDFKLKLFNSLNNDQPSNSITFIEEADCDTTKILSIVVSRFMLDVPKNLNFDELKKLASEIGIKIDIASPNKSNTHMSTQDALVTTLEQENQSASDLQPATSLKFIRQSLPHELYSDAINTIRATLKKISTLFDGEEQEWQQIPDLVKQLIDNYKHLKSEELQTTILVSPELQGKVADCVQSLLFRLIKENAQLLINLLQPLAVLTEDLAKQIGPQYELLKLIAKSFQEDITDKEIELKLHGSVIRKSISMWVDYIIDLHCAASERKIPNEAVSVAQHSGTVFNKSQATSVSTKTVAGEEKKATFGEALDGVKSKVNETLDKAKEKVSSLFKFTK